MGAGRKNGAADGWGVGTGEGRGGCSKPKSPASYTTKFYIIRLLIPGQKITVGIKINIPLVKNVFFLGCCYKYIHTKRAPFARSERGWLCVLRGTLSWVPLYEFVLGFGL